jgi:hypothetical protein
MTVWPQVCNYLVAAIPDLWPAVKVFDGAPVTGDNPDDYVTVGHVTDDTAGTWQQAAGDDGTWVHEVGTVRAELVVQTGDDDALPIVRARASGYIDILDAQVRADQTLGGILSTNATVLLGADVQGVKSNGTAFVVILTLTYTSISW